ncbi:unnamed protein product [Prorocentrum cordatum]|uniref:tRNA pseudouridine synthase n=1 Tax=Prorocentrum cordatum TaxID=2364126 RepID=A0ABN9TFG2_9DINO|nr:unnamed protein product [Polarella glacialis]
MFFDNGGPGVRPTTPTYTCSGTTPSNQHVRDVDPRWREVAKDIKMMFRAVLRQDGDEVTHLPRSWNNFGGPQTSREHDSQCATFHGMLHKFKLSRLVASCGEFAILRISSGDFFPEQCRKLVAAALCVHRGWLPPDFLSTATRPDVVLSIPSAPSHAICLEECRFFHWERSNGEGRLSKTRLRRIAAAACLSGHADAAKRCDRARPRHYAMCFLGRRGNPWGNTR